MPNPPSTLPAAELWAEVRARQRVMRYRRSGAGRSLLLLQTDRDAATLWPELGNALDGTFRVITPVVPSAVADLVAWLADFAEGLGLARVALLAGGELCIPALELALLDPDRFARAVLVPGEPGGMIGVESALVTTAHDLAVPLLIVPRATCAPEAMRRIAGFLAPDD
jgi:pimeloyl-ACP methyl ester carboxylesterase